MAISNVPNLSGGILFSDTDNIGTAVVVKASSAVIYAMELDNTANSAATFTRFYNTGTVTPGTTVPDTLIMTPASTKITMVFPSGWTFGTALAITSGTSATLATVTAPTSDFAIKIVYV